MRGALVAAVCLIAAASRALGEAWELFEDPAVPPGWTVFATGSSIQPVDTRSLQGQRSLEWVWGHPATSLIWDLPATSTGSGNLVFSQWVRLESALPDTRLRVDLHSTNGSTRTFEMNLDFTGWRTVFVPYSEMQGNGSHSIDRVRWTFAGAPPSGVLYLDQVILGQAMDVRYQYADRQAPFVWEGREKGMWENRLHWYRRRPPEVDPSLDEILGVRELRDKWDARLVGSGSVTATTVDQWATRMNRYNVRREEDRVRGNQIYYSRYPGNAYPPALAAELAGTEGPNDFQQYTTLMLDLARGWHRTEEATLRERIRDMLLLMSEHLLDQGWAAGSNQGSLSHYGYQVREYMRAVYLARELYAEAGLLEEMGEAARWYGQAGSLFDDERAPNMDFFNTLAQGQLLSLLMEPDEETQVAWVRAFSGAVGRQIADMRAGDANGFKSDGTAFHHNGHYPAYGIGAISTLGEIFDVLLDTPFTFGEAARMAFRNVLLAARAYSQKFDWPIGISGRHPFSGGIGSARGAFAALAQYPGPDSNTAPDHEIAAAYVRLWGQPGGDLGTLFAGAGILAEDPAGFYTFPFANHAVYRSGDWMVSLKGYSRYVWSSEIYAADNRYGRYQSNGTAEILLSSGRLASGFREQGWDWNRLPGTTTVHLPLDQLESPRTGTSMLRSDEVMAGGVTAEQDGAFAFILNQDRFGHILKARKSVFAADGMLISLGSGVSSNHATAPVETTLFQVALDASRAPLVLSTHPDAPVTDFPWTWQTTPSAPFWVLDSVGNGYWLPPGQPLRFSRVRQQSRHNKTKATTSGDFAAGWIDHGVGPEAAGYHYVILPQASASEMGDFDDRMTSAAPAYEVLRQDQSLHAVRIASPDRYGFAAFEPGRWEDLPHLIEADRPSLLWIEENGAEILLSVANPDLNPGATESLVSPTAFLLRGLWEQTGPNAAGALLWHENGNTKIAVPAREGASYPLRLQAAATPAPWSPGAENDRLSPVENFRAASPAGPALVWDPSADARHGYIVERMFPGAAAFSPVAILTSAAIEFFDEKLLGAPLAYYRVRKWDESGPGLPSRSLLIFDPGTESAVYDFRSLSDVNELWADGWTSSGLQSESDWYLTSRGMFLIDNSPTQSPSLTVPMTPRATGRVRARMGVARLANFHARIEILAGSQSLGVIQFTTRTDGFLRGPTEVTFTDDRWDVEQGTLRDIAIEWRELPGADRMEISLRYTGTTDAASAIHSWEISNTVANRPDRVRLAVGFGSAVDRGLVVETLEITSFAPYSLGSFYRAWAEAFLGDAAADPSADTARNGLPNLWEFLLACNPVDPAASPGPALMPSLQRVNGEARLVWDLPKLAEVTFRVEGKERLDGPWETVPHLEEPLAGSAGRVRVLSPPFDAAQSSGFYRLVASAILE